MDQIYNWQNFNGRSSFIPKHEPSYKPNHFSDINSRIIELSQETSDRNWSFQSKNMRPSNDFDNKNNFETNFHEYMQPTSKQSPLLSGYQNFQPDFSQRNHSGILGAMPKPESNLQNYFVKQNPISSGFIENVHWQRNKHDLFHDAFSRRYNDDNYLTKVRRKGLLVSKSFLKIIWCKISAFFCLKSLKLGDKPKFRKTLFLSFLWLIFFRIILNFF